MPSQKTIDEIIDKEHAGQLDLPLPKEAHETYEMFVARLFAKKHTGNDGYMHAAAGLSGESGEVLDLIKKVWVYGKPLDRGKLIEELGDIMFYWQAAANLLGLSAHEIKRENMRKLNKRYPQGYSDKAAIERVDVKANA